MSFKSSGDGVFIADSVSRSGGVVHNEHYMFTMGRSTVNDAGEIIERLKARYRVDSDSDLAAKLLISRSSVANWRNRNSVPARYRRLDEGEGNLFSFGQPYVEMTEVERAAMKLAFLRLVREFGDVATEYRTFLTRSGEAAASWQTYWVKACRDLYAEMDKRQSEDAEHCVTLLAYNEAFAEK